MQAQANNLYGNDEAIMMVRVRMIIMMIMVIMMIMMIMMFLL